MIGTQKPTQHHGFVTPADTEIASQASASIQGTTLSGINFIPALPLTPEAFAPFGKVIQGYGDLNAVPRDTKVTSANQASAYKFHKQSLLESTYSPESGATSGLSVYRCQPINVKPGEAWDVKLLERHIHTNQAFIPMSGGNVVDVGEGLPEHARSYLVIVAKNGENDAPDLETMRAFIASTAQGISYDTGIWRECDILARIFEC